MYPIIHISESFYVPTYLIIISLAYILCSIWLVIRTEKFKQDRNTALDLALAVMIGGFVGSRIFHVVFEQPNLYWQQPSLILMFWLGGFVFYGGLIGSLVTTSAYFWTKKLVPWVWLDIFAPLFPFGYALGRISCFLAGCCYGRECPYPWAVHFPPGVEAPPQIPLHPTQLYAVVWELGVLAVLLTMEACRSHFKSRQAKTSQQKSWQEFLLPPGQLIFIWGILHAVGRLFMEAFRDDFRGAFIWGLSISTWLSILLLIGCAFGFYYRAQVATTRMTE